MKRPPTKTTREPWIEAQLRQVLDQGSFMNLAGAGEPIADIDQPYDPDWWLKKLIKRERLSVVPRAVEIRRKIEQALEEAWKSRDERTLRRRLDQLNARIARWNATTVSGPATTVSGVDVEAAVERWRGEKAADPREARRVSAFE